ncbi:hypothetical protein MSMTP_2915 [Methanosarcina sp. MTP4]|uniref:DUF1699 family protein n=1 Tax=Methanosarcina sp. MTP4 TaxID=1434100 RepID=UPI000615D9B8|nr:DUF1699 family protein [Methanosarcina sp. MTP4]AKB26384.1 hypothetical protein MSMTP_2915 [Methanosarcina sp. MTP4]
MKLRVVSSKEEIDTLNESEELIHFAFRPSNKDIFKLIIRCPNVKAIHVPSSYKKTISSSAQMYLSMQGIALLEGDVWGHRKDINEYSEVPPNVFDRITELKSEGLSEQDIVEKIKGETKLSPDFITFIMSI